MANIDYNALGNVLDTTWGRSSTPRTASYSIKLTLRGTDQILCKYQAIVNFATEHEMEVQKRRYSEEARAVIKQTISLIKKNYKEITDSSLKMKLLEEMDPSAKDNIEIINFNVHNAKRTAYYRHNEVYQIG